MGLISRDISEGPSMRWRSRLFILAAFSGVLLVIIGPNSIFGQGKGGKGPKGPGGGGAFPGVFPGGGGAFPGGGGAFPGGGAGGFQGGGGGAFPGGGGAFPG